MANRKNKTDKTNKTKIFIVDTNVLLHDPSSLFRFEEHDLFIPMITLEELDTHKKGLSEVSRNARQVSRVLDDLIRSSSDDIELGIDLAPHSHKAARGRLYFQTQAISANLPSDLPIGKADNQILAVVIALKNVYLDRDVILVSKDINMRIKARALNLESEDYYNDKVLEDSDLLYTGSLQINDKFWRKNGKDLKSWQEQGYTYYQINGPDVADLFINQMLWQDDGDHPLILRVIQIEGKSATLQTIRDYSHNKNAVWGILAKNREQSFALNLLMDPEIDFVSLLGQAGTGKTLLTLAAALTLTLEKKIYNEIIITRVTVPVGEDIGFLPGTEEEKMHPWMGALEDNLEVLTHSDDASGAWGKAASNDFLQSRIKIKSLNFMRGRTFQNKFLIIDEAQNLTPKQMKTLITRAGPGTKVVCMGNLTQIDTPYLTEGSSGLSYVVDRFKGWPHSAHITLQRGERSRLAYFASETL